MRAVIRTYSGPGAKKLFAELEKNKAKIETLIKPVKGLVSYSLVSTADGGMSVTVCKDQKGIDESTRVASEWIKENLPSVATKPSIAEGSVVVHLT
jgi:hypothetical protein